MLRQPVDRPSLKRRRTSDALEENINNDLVKNDHEAEEKPLQGAVVCLSGMSLEEKERHHRHIRNLGGSVTSEFHSNKNTHLVVAKTEGAKFETAKLFHGKIRIVMPSWLDACYKQKRWVDESNHDFSPTMDGGALKPAKEDAAQLVDQISQQLLSQETTQIETIFSSCYFYLVGFEEESRLHIELSRLIRRGMGTIYWDLHDQTDGTVMVVVNDLCDKVLCDSSCEKANTSERVSPWWVLMSWKNLAFEDISRYPPKYKSKSAKPLNSLPSGTFEKEQLNVPKIFSGSIFILLRNAVPEGAVDFDSRKLESSITTLGGQLLSQAIIDALEGDCSRSNTSRRTCYAICWGEYKSTDLALHPLLARVKRKRICTIVETTPIWLETCLEERQVLAPSLLPKLFQPTRHAIYFLSKSRGIEDKNKKSSIQITVSGYKGYQRTAFARFAEALGCQYDDSLRSTTTHLICQEANGPKYEKALQWKLHIVSIDWLYYVARYGVEGQNGEKLGCEARFRVGNLPPPEEPEPV